jgi:diguanylate cyclase (GGDEF)-like protein/PAS domain S-box-containing protein
MEQSISFEKMTRQQLTAEILRLNIRLAELEAREAEHRQAMEALLENIKKYRLLLDESSDPIFMFDKEGTYLYVNRAFADGVARKLEEINSRKIWDVFSPEEAEKRFAVVKWVFEHGETRVIEVRVPRPDGDKYYITTVKPIRGDDGGVMTVICISKEITERKRMEDELRYISTHDYLTGLYNRLFFETEMDRIQNSRLYPISVVMADYDSLKKINDTLGHKAGDAYIKKAAAVMKRIFRTEDIIARVGGDEFVILLPQTSEDTAADMVARMQNEISGEQDPLFSLSIGYATAEKDSSLLDLARIADERLYAQKSTKKG